MRQTFLQLINETFVTLKRQNNIPLSGFKGDEFHKVLGKKIGYEFNNLYESDLGKWENLNIGAMDPDYIADVVLRVEFILHSLLELTALTGKRYSLSDYRFMLASPILPHRETFSQECQFIEAKLRAFFSNKYGHKSVILRDFNYYFAARFALGDGLFSFNKIPAIQIDEDFLNMPLFGDVSPLFISTGSINNLSSAKTAILKRVIQSPLSHKNNEVMPNSRLLEKWFPNGVVDNNSASYGVKFAVKDKMGEIYAVNPLYNTMIKNSYLSFQDKYSSKAATLNQEIKNNESILISVSDLKSFVVENMQANDPEGMWLSRFNSINFYDTNLQKRVDKISINNINHWIGLPNVGKTTLMTILAAYLAIVKGVKSCLVLRDNRDVDATANTLIKCKVNAIPFIGTSNQGEHLKRRLGNLSCVDDIASDKIVDYYSNSCKLKSLLDLGVDDNLDKSTLCHSVTYVSGNLASEANREVFTRNNSYKGRLDCPFIYECEKHTSRAEFSNAQVYLTNIQSLMLSVTEKGLFRQTVSNYELLTKECSIIMVDEADDMINSCDSKFIDEEYIVEGVKKGFLQRLSEEVDREVSGKKSLHKGTTKWLRSARNFISVSEIILHIIQEEDIPKGIVRKPFTSRSIISYLIPRAIKSSLVDISLSNSDSRNVDDERDSIGTEFEDFALDKKRQDMAHYFHTYLDSFYWSYEKNNSFVPDDPLINDMLNAANSAYLTIDGDFHEESAKCFNAFMEKFEITLDTSSNVGVKRVVLLKSLFKLALAVSNFEVVHSYLQSHIDDCRGFIKDEELLNSVGFSSSFYKHYDGLIPFAAGGAAYGLSYEIDGHRKSLELKKYFNIGRHILLNMPTIFSGLDKTNTSRVILLSATSYMPHSPNYHIPFKPDYILEGTDTSNLSLTYKKMFLYDEQGEVIKFSGASPLETPAILEQIAKDLCAIDPYNLNAESKLDKIFNTTLEGRKRVAFTVGSFDEAISFTHALKKQLTVNGLLDKYKLCIIDSSEDRTGHEGIDVFIKSNLNRFKDSDYNIVIIVTKSMERGVNVLNQEYVAAFSTLVYLKRPYIIPNNLSDLVALLNSHSMNKYMLDYDSASAYMGAPYSISGFMKKVETDIHTLRGDFYNRTYYRFIKDDSVRMSIIANLLVTTHQLEGRFYRGNVPATIIYADGAFFPEEAKNERHRENYTTSIVEGFKWYFSKLESDVSIDGSESFEIVKKLYGFRINALGDITTL